MRWWGFLTGAVLVVSCAGKGGPPQAPADEPPPRGAPQPRAVDQPWPPPGRISETAEVNEQRFPILENQQRRERQQRAQQQASGHVGVVGNKSQSPVHACDGLTADEKVECPLSDPKAVASITDLPSGARVTLRPGATTPEKLQQLFACHKSLAVARPQGPTACAFFDARTDAEVTVRNGSVDVDIERGTGADEVRTQVRSALRHP